MGATNHLGTLSYIPFQHFSASLDCTLAARHPRLSRPRMCVSGQPRPSWSESVLQHRYLEANCDVVCLWSDSDSHFVVRQRELGEAMEMASRMSGRKRSCGL